MKSLCNIYKRDELNAQKQYKETKAKLEDVEYAHKLEMNRITGNFEERINDLKAQISEAQNQ
jgi:hypothetical protein